jgi:galactonate dehydratase
MNCRPNIIWIYCGSELALTQYAVRNLIEHEAIDIVMTVVTWTGSIAESRKIASHAKTYSLPFVAHDCTGPITLLASIHLSVHCPNALIQESVRAYYHGLYKELTTEQPRIEDGFAYPPDKTGIRTEPRPEIFERSDCTIRETNGG